ncbi:helix-turn-helix transcriptional regulator [Amycolatopsis sp. OK19-0408]|uniref:Helix-turn-helix transcriptional regulator n=1 Tax=Amycolatopsis iheyensis TaxID=2945988 RepID=A0A9X2N7A1_9PSEU|nr:helix-turn-helix transcriptional regulator [Amycolatopsis iheyensis]MCR6482128.1 helix-turn-helix transcriptional regulator [Amycolatopsis iheyensis]
MSSELTARCLHRALDVVNEFRAAGPAAGLAGLGRLIGCDIVSCTSTEHTTRRLTGTVTDRPEHNLMRHPEFRANAHQHPAFAAHREGRLALGTAVALTDLADLRTLRALPLYTDFYRPRGTVDQLLCVVQVDARHGRILTLSRSRPGFSPREHALADLLVPHLGQAFARAEAPAVQPLAGVSADVLTTREREVAELVARAATDREIARRLGISARTVQKHLQQSYRKLGVASRTELMVHLR